MDDWISSFLVAVWSELPPDGTSALAAYQRAVVDEAAKRWGVSRALIAFSGAVALSMIAMVSWRFALPFVLDSFRTGARASHAASSGIALVGLIVFILATLAGCVVFVGLFRCLSAVGYAVTKLGARKV
jgi:hypothetical protein